MTPIGTPRPRRVSVMFAQAGGGASL